jgi:hypothetical protein
MKHLTDLITIILAVAVIIACGVWLDQVETANALNRKISAMSDDRKADLIASGVAIYGLLIAGCIGTWGWN